MTKQFEYPVTGITYGEWVPAPWYMKWLGTFRRRVSYRDSVGGFICITSEWEYLGYD